MIRFIIFAILCYVLYRVVKSLVLPSPAKPRKPFTQAYGTITDEMVMDPHCHVYIPKREAITVKTAGETLYFCSKECKKKYLEENRN
ncbi:MAG: hypothetical protein KAJ00_01665 [Deltaproteobacteria bacterium]|nr:hypothetical protein [Deltaproteobacteria bacterium]NOQ87154.1 YHS domain-containing protein [Deltaproteobacteria bacterium]